MLYKFTYDDPDGNGANDTYGLEMCKYTGPWDIIQTWFGCGNGWVEQDGKLEVVHCKGKVSGLAQLVEPLELTGTCGIGHTRWATNGEPSDVNATRTPAWTARWPSSITASSKTPLSCVSTCKPKATDSPLPPTLRWPLSCSARSWTRLSRTKASQTCSSCAPHGPHA